MNLSALRDWLKQGQIELDLSLPHAITEARKDGLTSDDLEDAVLFGELIEEYGDRVLLLHFATGYRIPFHVVLEFVPGDHFATIVTAYIPDRQRWESDWKTRKRIRSKRNR